MLFFDIVFFDSASCWSDSAVAFHEKHDFLHSDPETQANFESAAQTHFNRRFSALIADLATPD